MGKNRKRRGFVKVDKTTDNSQVDNIEVNEDIVKDDEELQDELDIVNTEADGDILLSEIDDIIDEVKKDIDDPTDEDNETISQEDIDKAMLDDADNDIEKFNEETEDPPLEEDVVDNINEDSVDTTDDEDDELTVDSLAATAEDDSKEIAGLKEAKDLLTSSQTIDDKLTWCLRESKLLSGIAGVLEDYNKNMSALILEENMAVGQQQQLLNILLNIANTEDLEEFTVKMDMLMLYFIKYKDESFNETKTARFDYIWTGTQKELTTLLNLTYTFANLADRTTRKENLESISLDKAFSIDDTVLSNDAANRLKNYFV